MATVAPTSDDTIIWETWLSQYRLPMATVHDEAGTFAALADTALTTEELAAKIGADARALGIHLGVLASSGLVEKRMGKWQATDASRTWLDPEAEGYYGPMLKSFANMPLHAQLRETLTTGQVASGREGAVEEWERGEMSAEMASRITAFMNSHSLATSRANARQPIYADIHRLMDVGGGSGVFAIELAKAWPEFSAAVYEIPPVCVEVDKYVERAGLADRVEALPGNMFTDDWPTGYDAHFLSNVFHDWSDATCRLLAKKSFDALPSGGRILLHEMLMDDDGAGPYMVAAFSALMLLGTRGKQYSLPELADILGEAGFVDVRSVRTGGALYSLVSARKP